MTDTKTLSGIDLFDGLPPEALSEVESLADWRKCSAEELVFDRHTDTLDVFIVVSGSVRILSNAASVESENYVPLADVQAGNWFGEVAAIDHVERSARVVAIEETLLASLPGKTFIDLMYKYPMIAHKVLLRFCRIIRDLDKRVSDMSALDEFQRIYSELLRIAKPDPNSAQRMIILDLPNHKEIAGWAGTPREIVAQAIGELARRGIVERRSMGLVIHDAMRLRQLTESKR